MKRLRPQPPSRRGNVVVLFALLIVLIIGMLAFSIDVGYIMLIRTQLQSAADSAALAAASQMGESDELVLAEAREFAAYQHVAAEPVELGDDDIQYGNWDSATRSFTQTAEVGNAIRVIARRDDTTNGEAPLFFARIFGRNSFPTQASAVAMTNPRDICFVVDLSGSMNDDSEPCWATAAINAEFGPDGYPTVGDQLMQNLYTDLDYGTFPGTTQSIGSPLGVSAGQQAYHNLTRNSGVLTAGSIPSTYRISSSNSESTRKTKAYRWIIDYQIATIMPNARPVPNSATNYSYWEKYLDYVIWPYSNSRGALPPSQDSDRIDDFNNPNNDGYPSASSSVPQGFRNLIGYRTYVQFMMDHGRDTPVVGSTYSPLSRSSADCRYHSESTAGGTFSFPPREQPTHAARRSLIAAIQVVKERNESIVTMSQRDWVSVVTYDKLGSSVPVVLQSLTGNYDVAMQACTTMQAVADNTYSTATEAGLIYAKNHIRSTDEGGMGRRHTQKVVILLTDGMPNLYQSSNGTISSYRSSNPSSNFFGGSAYAKDAPLMQAMSMQLEGWSMFPVGIGLGTDYTFMDRMARMGGTEDDNGQSPRGSGNPAEYEDRVTEIFEEIIRNPKVRLVQ
jgi:hypothetical protein